MGEPFLPSVLLREDCFQVLWVSQDFLNISPRLLPSFRSSSGSLSFLIICLRVNRRNNNLPVCQTVNHSSSLEFFLFVRYMQHVACCNWLISNPMENYVCFIVVAAILPSQHPALDRSKCSMTLCSTIHPPFRGKDGSCKLL